MKELNEMNLEEKKAYAYDIMVQLELLRQELMRVNQSISEHK